MKLPATRSLLKVVTLACVAAGWATPGRTHDFWIEPSAFRATPGVGVPVALRVGEDFSGTSQPFVPDWFVDFSVSSAAGREPVKGFVGDDPAATLVMKTPGLRLIGYRSHRSFVYLDAERFNKYLQTEGLDAISALRRQRGESQAKAREYYSRCAKSLVLAGAAPPGERPVHDAVLGYPLELIPLTNPYEVSPGGQLPIELRYQGRPIAGVLVIAFTADRPAQRFQARTGADGLVRLPLDRAGRWLVKAVHMIALPESEADAEWESFWASLTFEVRGSG